VRSIVFDIGGVLIDWDPRHLYRRLIPDEDERERFLAEVCTMDWNITLDAGRPFDEACDELAARHPEHAELVHAWKRQDEMIAGEIPGTSAIVRRLRAAGVPLYLLTNMPSDVFADRVAAYDALRGFDGAVVSGEEGVIKPDPEIFRRVAERFGVEPGETLFIDDSERNVVGAREAGFQAHRFVDAPTLEQALVDLGLL
jgi:2-haloacid dehalogenase